MYSVDDVMTTSTEPNLPSLTDSFIRPYETGEYVYDEIW